MIKASFNTAKMGSRVSLKLTKQLYSTNLSVRTEVKYTSVPLQFDQLCWHQHESSSCQSHDNLKPSLVLLQENLTEKVFSKLMRAHAILFMIVCKVVNTSTDLDGVGHFQCQSLVLWQLLVTYKMTECMPWTQGLLLIRTLGSTLRLVIVTYL